MSQSGGKKKTQKSVVKRATKRVAKRATKRVVKRVVKRKPAKTHAKRKGSRKRTSDLSSKYSMEMLVSPQSGMYGGSLEDALNGAQENSDKMYSELRGSSSGGPVRRRKRSATKRTATKRKTVKRRTSSRSASRSSSRSASGKPRRRRTIKRVDRDVKELAMMGHNSLSSGLHVPINAQFPFDSKYLVLNPDLRQKVYMSDPVSRNLLSSYGPGWSGYEIGLQMKGNRPTRKITSPSPVMGVAMHPHLHPALGNVGPRGPYGPQGGLQGGPFGNPLGSIFGGPLGNQGRVSDWEKRLGLGENVRVQHGLESMPGQRMSVTSDLSPFGAPSTITTAHIGIDRKAMPAMPSMRGKKAPFEGDQASISTGKKTNVNPWSFVNM